MTNFWLFLRSLIVAVALIFATQFLLLSPQVLAQTTGGTAFNLGVLELKQGNYTAAIAQFNRAIQQKEKTAAAYSNRCLAYLYVLDYHQAIADCTQAINFVPNNLEAYLNRGLAYYRQGNYFSAIEDDNLAIALKPNDFRAYYNRGVAHNALSDYTAAITDFNLALTQIAQIPNFSFADIYNDRGLAHFHLHNVAAAMQNFQFAIRFHTQDSRAYFNLGCVSAWQGNDREAISNFSHVIQLEPNNAKAYLNRAIAEYNLGYHQRAIADLNQASKYFANQNQTVAYEQTKGILKLMQQEIQLAVNIG
ncbi:tetratricopeptide repeat protein [Nostoc sp. FACHB-110]|uniref:tetratricopeptide repeat protein n=1 Tax=Nostoc sp. FACHB-110 TaxID=2692834 RepID=UPI00168872B5|nr:tetratricopeptide repeat protein [Nostoc sp. FACHB-110]MBD2436867.1 tetratricopeptide repeat protein [Nostoc sp. FACHB-110]